MRNFWETGKGIGDWLKQGGKDWNFKKKRNRNNRDWSCRNRSRFKLCKEHARTSNLYYVLVLWSVFVIILCTVLNNECLFETLQYFLILYAMQRFVSSSIDKHNYTRHLHFLILLLAINITDFLGLQLTMKNFIWWQKYLAWQLSPFLRTVF